MIQLPFPKKTRYINFGYLPVKPFTKNMYEWFTGHPNPAKRIQAPAIMKAIGLQPNDVVLDAGCGGGYFTVEFAKNAKKAIGIDLKPQVNNIKVPRVLSEKLEYIQASVLEVPFPDNYFDKVVISEVISCFSDAKPVIEEMKRVLKPGGQLTVINGVGGHAVLNEAYATNHPKLMILKRKYPERFPATIEAYEEALNRFFGNDRVDFMSEEQVLELVADAGFKHIKKSYSFGQKMMKRFSWRQFEVFLKTGNPVFIGWHLRRYLFWRFVEAFDRTERKSGALVVTATKA